MFLRFDQERKKPQINIRHLNVTQICLKEELETKFDIST